MPIHGGPSACGVLHLSQLSEVSMGSMSAVHWLIVALVVLLVFGPMRLADAGKGLGEGIRNFKKGISDGDGEDKQVTGKEGEGEKRQLSGPT
jgi:sec-independent protein translocase protein TatA